MSTRSDASSGGRTKTDFTCANADGPPNNVSPVGCATQPSEPPTSKGIIGSSRAGAILGLSHWSKPIDVWLEIVEGLEKESTPEMEWGVRLEPVVVRKFEEVHGCKVVKPESIMLRDWLRVSPDGLTDLDGPCVVEAKTSSWFMRDKWGEEGTDQVSDDILVQVQLQLAATGRRVAHIPCLIAGNDYREYLIQSDTDLQNTIISRLEEWYQKHIVGGARPEIVHSETVSKWLKNRWPLSGPPARAATFREEEELRAFAKARDGLDKAKKEHDDLGAKIRASIADCEGLYADGIGVTYKSDKNGKRSLRWKEK